MARWAVESALFLGGLQNKPLHALYLMAIDRCIDLFFVFADESASFLLDVKILMSVETVFMPVCFGVERAEVCCHIG